MYYNTLLLIAQCKDIYRMKSLLYFTIECIMTTRIYGSDVGHLDGNVSYGIIYLSTIFPENSGNENLSFPIEARTKLVAWLNSL